jgi:hypothetical protein
MAKIRNQRPQVSPALAVLQTVGGYQGSVTAPYTLNTLKPLAQNSMAVVALSIVSFNGPDIVVTDNAPGGSNTYTEAQRVWDGQHNCYSLLYAPVINPGATALTVTSGFDFSGLDMYIIEYGRIGASTYKYSNGWTEFLSGSDYQTVPNWRTNPVTISADDLSTGRVLLVAFGGGSYHARRFTVTPGTNWRLIAHDPTAGSMVEDRMVSQPGSYEGFGDIRGNNLDGDVMNGVIVAFWTPYAPTTAPRRRPPLAGPFILP